MHRRLFLRIAAVGAASTLTGSGCARPGAESGELQALARPDLLDILGDEPVRAIGASYRDMRPAERTEGALRAAIHGRHPLLVRLLGPPDVIPAELVHHDFAMGRTVTVEGWVLSVTEARQCALASLTRP